MKLFICKNCNKEFESKKSCKSRQPKFCSSKCYGESLKMNKKCKLCDNIIENKHSVSLKNRVYCSKDCQSKARRGVKLPDEWRKALSEGRKASGKCKGENLYNWRGGKDTEKIRMRESFYKRKKSLKLKMPISFLENLLVAQKNLCFFCEQDLTNYKAIEHLTPVSRGGDNEKYNLVYSCKSCNSKKRQQTLEEFALNTKNVHWLSKWEYIFTESL